jgi:hypothetical protein
MFTSKRKPKSIDRFRVGKGSPTIKTFLYRLMNKPYLDIKIFRGYKEITRIVTPDTGMRQFSVEGIGTFVVPTGDYLLRQYFNKHCIYLNYNLQNSNPGEPVEAEKWTQYEYPPLSPEEFQVLLEAQTVADLLSETEKDTKWIWYLLIGGIVLVGLIMLMGGA